ncbi:unnamed protein product [Phytomonas sp. Hart1]|nr:unnamed protein product [Phytomonas sp. Hart1]|eukprot:CCW70097.1 unnamed protein product [Phytomonas sp. isolate Hart1]
MQAMNVLLSRVGTNEAAVAASKLQGATEGYSAMLLKTVGFKSECIRELSEGSLVFPWTSNKESLNAFGTVHGGVLSTLADVFTRIHLKAAVPQLHVTSISLEISFLSPVFEDKECVCVTRLVGKRDNTVFTNFSLEDGSGAIYARGSHILSLS